MKKLLRYFHGYWHMVILAPTFKFFEALMELVTPLLVAQIIDVAISGGDIGYVWILGGAMLGAAALGFGLSVSCQYLASRAGQAYATAIRADMLKRVNLLSFADLDRLTPSSLAARITNDVNQTQQGVSMAMRLLSRSPFLIIGATVGAFVISPTIASVFVAVAVLIAIMLYFVMSRSAPYYRRSAQQLDVVSARTKENLTGARVIRAYARGADSKAAAHAEIDELARINLRSNRISSLLNPLSLFIVNLGVIAVIVWGGWHMDNGSGMTSGKIVALVNYLTQIQLSLVVLANLIVTLTRTSAANRRINEVLEMTPSQSEPSVCVEPNFDAPAVELNYVTFGYHLGGAPCIENVNAVIRTGDTYGVIGGTGSGKSTLISLILRHYDPIEGSVRLFGADAKLYPAAQIQTLFAYVPQRPALLQGTIRSNLIWRKPDATDEDLWAALDDAQASEFVRKYADGLDHAVAVDGRNFSGGQRQRLTVARALVGDARILILDDACSALDAATDARLRAAVKARGITTVLVSQRVPSLMNCDCILVLDGGKTAGVGTHAELVEKCPVYKEIFDGQVRGTKA